MKNGNKRITIQIADADAILQERCMKNAKHLYGDPIPARVLERMETELKAIRENGHSSHYVLASDLAMVSEEKGYPVSSRGKIASSLTAILSGISQVNPLPAHYRCPFCHHFEIMEHDARDGRLCGCDLPAAVCPECGTEMIRDGFDILPEVNMGIDLEREPEIIMDFAPEMRVEVINYLRERFGWENVFRAGQEHEMRDGSLKKRIHPGGVFIIPEDVKITDITPLRDTKSNDEFNLRVTDGKYRTLTEKIKNYDILPLPALGMLHDLEAETGVSHNGITPTDEEVIRVFSENKNGFMKSFSRLERGVIMILHPDSFSDLARIHAVGRGTDTWHGNGEGLILSGKKLKEIITTRDDVMQYLMGCGLDKTFSYMVMMRVIAGKGLTQEMTCRMREAGVPEWYIVSCNKIKFAFTWAQAVEYSMINYKLAFYSCYYPDAYQRALQKYYERPSDSVLNLF